jgi:hypothetical protein
MWPLAQRLCVVKKQASGRGLAESTKRLQEREKPLSFLSGFS